MDSLQSSDIALSLLTNFDIKSSVMLLLSCLKVPASSSCALNFELILYDLLHI
jgi:hypothetical protein